MKSSVVKIELGGRWQMVRAALDGTEAPELVAQKTVLELSRGHYCVSFDGAVVDQGTFEIDPAFPNRRLLFGGTAGPNAGRLMPSLYQHVGDRLRICYGLDGLLPTAFPTTGCHQHYLATYRRISWA